MFGGLTWHCGGGDGGIVIRVIACVGVEDVPVVGVVVGVVCPWLSSSLPVFSDGIAASRVYGRFSDKREFLALVLFVTREDFLDPSEGMVINQEWKHTR